MRRGLISWSKSELPESVLDARAARAQAAMAQAGIDALAIYSDPARSGGGSWLSGFIPYWNRGLMLLPRKGKPTLYTGMSNRVHGWIKTNAHLEAVIYSTKIGSDAASAVGKDKAAAVVAIADIDKLPGGIVDGLKAGVSVIDGTALFEKLRAPCDPTEIAFYFKAAAIARAAIAAARSDATDGAALVGDIEGQARRLGAEEIYVGLARDLAVSPAMVRLEGMAPLGGAFAVRVSVGYKGTWVRMARTLSRDETYAADIAAATEQFAAATAALPKTDGLAACRSWLIEGCRTTQPLEPLAGSLLDQNLPIMAGTVVSVQATLAMPSGPVTVGAPVLVGKVGEGSSLLVQLPT